MGNLSEQRQASAQALFYDLQKAVGQWLSYRGVDQPCTVSRSLIPPGSPP